MVTVDIELDAAGIERRLAVVCGYLADAGYQANLTAQQVVEIHEGIVTLAALQAMCATLRRLGSLRLTVKPRAADGGLPPARTGASLRRPRRPGAGRRTA